MTCTFFGHKDAPQTIETALRETLKYLIEHKNINVFYVGNHGQFDYYVRKALRELVGHYSTVRYHVVLSHLPVHPTDCDYSETLLPEGIEAVPKRFAISWCNNMDASAIRLCGYVRYPFMGRRRAVQGACRKARKDGNQFDLTCKNHLRNSEVIFSLQGHSLVVVGAWCSAVCSAKYSSSPETSMAGT